MNKFVETVKDLVAISVFLSKEAIFRVKDLVIDIVREFRK